MCFFTAPGALAAGFGSGSKNGAVSSRSRPNRSAPGLVPAEKQFREPLGTSRRRLPWRAGRFTSYRIDRVSVYVTSYRIDRIDRTYRSAPYRIDRIEYLPESAILTVVRNPQAGRPVACFRAGSVVSQWACRDASQWACRGASQWACRGASRWACRGASQ